MNQQTAKQYAIFFLMIFLVLYGIVAVSFHPIMRENILLKEYASQDFTLISGLDTTAIGLFMNNSFHPFITFLHLLSVYSFLCFLYYLSNIQKNKLQVCCFILSSIISGYFLIGTISSSAILNNRLGITMNLIILVGALTPFIAGFIMKKKLFKRISILISLPIIIYEIIQLLNLFNNPSLFSLSYLCFISFYYNMGNFYMGGIVILTMLIGMLFLYGMLLHQTKKSYE